MNLEDLIVSTISDAKPMMILALCTIVLFVIVASLIEAWLAKARKAKSEADTLPSGPEASQRSVEKSEAVEQAVDNAGGFDLDERRKARAPKLCLLTKVIPILLPGPAADERGLAVQRMVLAAFDHVHRRRPARFTALPAAKARLDDG